MGTQSTIIVSKTPIKIASSGDKLVWLQNTHNSYSMLLHFGSDPSLVWGTEEEDISSFFLYAQQSIINLKLKDDLWAWIDKNELTLEAEVYIE